MSTVNRDDLEKFHELDVHVPSRTILLFGEIDQETAEKFIKNFVALEFSEEPITILLNTQGGAQDHGMAIYDTIRRSASHVCIVVTGCAYSMGSVILQAADRRLVTKYSSVMFHRGEIHVTATGKEAANTAQFDEAYSDALDEIIYSKVVKSAAWGGSLSRDQFMKINEKSMYLRGLEAVEWGLADDVV